MSNTAGNPSDRAWLESQFRAAGMDGRDGTVALPANCDNGDHSLSPELRPNGPLKPAAVLVPILASDRGFSLVLTQRAAHLKAHAGQISFPGGRIEADDRSPLDAALREAEEEIALPKDRVSLLGTLDLYVTGTGYAIHPYVGLIEGSVEFRPQESEVADIFDVPLDFLLAPENMVRDSVVFRGRRRHFYALDYDGRYIWGATAGMIRSLRSVLNGVVDGGE